MARWSVPPGRHQLCGSSLADGMINWPALHDAVRTHPVALRLPVEFEPRALVANLERVEPSAWGTYDGRYYDAGRYLSASVVGTGVLDSVVSTFPGEVRMARLMCLLPGGHVLRHRDRHWPRDVVRIHVPITTGESVEFSVGGVTVRMRVGEAWYIDPRFPHEVHNRGTTDRVHLIVDLRRDLRLNALLERGASVRRGFLTSYLLREVLFRLARGAARMKPR